MKQKTNGDQIDLKRVIMVYEVEISARIMQLSNQGLLIYTPTQLLPDDNPDLCNLVWEGDNKDTHGRSIAQRFSV